MIMYHYLIIWNYLEFARAHFMAISLTGFSLHYWTLKSISYGFYRYDCRQRKEIWVGGLKKEGYRKGEGDEYLSFHSSGKKLSSASGSLNLMSAW